MKLILAILFLAVTAYADTHTAISLTLADVQSACDSASDGDIVQLPAGTVEWTDYLRMTNITLRGAGTNLSGTCTIITNNRTGPHVSAILMRGSNNTGRVRVTQLVIDGIAKNRCIEGGGFTYYAPMRIDHCIFLHAHDRAINCPGFQGVIDHCQFIECDLIVRAEGHDSYGVTDLNTYAPHPFNSTNLICVEDCYIYAKTNTTSRAFVSSGTGGSYCVRYNTFNIDNAPLEPCFDVHGNTTTNNWGTACNPGGLAAFIYGNIFNFGTNGTVNPLTDLRGGQSLLVCSNTVSGGTSIGGIVMREEEALVDVTAVYNLVSNAYYWNNYKTGPTLIEPSVSTAGTYSTNFIFINENYFTNAPVGLTLLQYPHPLSDDDIPIAATYPPQRVGGWR